MFTRLVYVLLLTPVCAMADVPATVLWYAEQEAGVPPYRVRYIVSEHFMRSDDGNDQGDFVLYDRRSHRIFSVTREERRILQIDGEGTVPVAPDALELEIGSSVDKQAPLVAGRHPLQVRLMAGDRLCYMATVVPDFLPDARDAFLEFNRALAVQQVLSLDNTPEEFQTPCFLLRYLYATDFYLLQGLPLVALDGRGDRRELLNYETGVDVDADLFVVPDGYEVQRPLTAGDAGR